ncbi:MAG: ABC transporter permease subunit [Pirellulales bacterium]
MGLDRSHYHPWQGRLHSPWLATLAIVRVALMQLFRRKIYWIVLALGLVNFLLFWTIIYILTQLQLDENAQKWILDRFGFSPTARAGQESGYISFMLGQNIVVGLLLPFSGSLLVGSDFQHKTLPFYLSRRIDRRHYIVGKLLAVSTIISLITTIPALILFVEWGMFTGSLSYWMDNWRVALSVVGFGAVICLTLSILLVSISAHLQKAAPIAIAWIGLFFLMAGLAELLRTFTGNNRWRLFDLWRNMRLVGRLCFDQVQNHDDRVVARQAAAILAAVCAIALIALVRRVRAVDVVE